MCRPMKKRNSTSAILKWVVLTFCTYATLYLFDTGIVLLCVQNKETSSSFSGCEKVKNFLQYVPFSINYSHNTSLSTCNVKSSSAIEESNASNNDKKEKKNIFKRIVKATSSIFQKKKRSDIKKEANDKNRSISESKQTKTTSEISVQSYYYKYSSSQISQANELARRVRDSNNLDTKAFNKRVSAVHWGGDGPQGYPWWEIAKKKNEDGLALSLSYLRIMKFPKDFMTNFPFGKCKKTKCPAEFAIEHTLQWREIYKPWASTPSSINENRNGFVYTRGYSPSLGGDGEPGPSLIFYRPGIHTAENIEAYTRALFNEIELAIVDTLKRSNGKHAKYNVVMDNSDFKISKVGGLSEIKRAFIPLQDHVPDKLGHLFLTNFSSAAQLVLKLLLPFIAEEVRNKIHVVPNEPIKRQEILNEFLGVENVPYWLGGQDTWNLNAKSYFMKRPMITDEEGIRFLSLLPYYA